MVTYIATVWAQHGHEDDVARFYLDQEESLKAAEGFRSRQIMQAKPGTMLQAVLPYLNDEERARADKVMEEGHGPKGVHFIVVEQWDSIDQKTRFSRAQDSGRQKDLIPHLLPEHTHEYYSDITPRQTG